MFTVRRIILAALYGVAMLLSTGTGYFFKEDPVILNSLFVIIWIQSCYGFYWLSEEYARLSLFKKLSGWLRLERLFFKTIIACSSMLVLFALFLSTGYISLAIAEYFGG